MAPVGAGLLAAAAPLAAWAQDAPPKDAGADGAPLVEVTAQRQRQASRDVPMSLSAWDAGAVQAHDLNSLASLAGLAPSTSIASVPGSGLMAYVGVRGLTSGQPGLWADPTVAVYVDGVFLGKSMATMLDVADVLRVEALRGPQGTLYGRNASAGAIHFITRAPSGVAGGSVRASLGSGNGRDLRVSLDLPTLGPVAASVWLRRQHQDGAIEGPARAPWGTRQRDAARLALAGEAFGRLEWRFSADHGEVDELPVAGWLSAARGYASVYPAASPVGALAQAFAAGPGRGLLPWVQADAPASVSSGDELGPPSQRARINGQSLQAEWRLGDGSLLRWISAHRRVDEGVTQDLDGSPRFVLGLDRESTYRLRSHELQWTGAQPGWRHVFGLYAMRDAGRSVLHQGGEILSFRVGQPGWQVNAFDVDTMAWAAFGQVDLERDGFGIGLGARVSRETRGVRVDRYTTDAGFQTVRPPGALQLAAQASFGAVTPVLQVSADLPGGTKAFARYARGFRSGAFPAEAPVTPTAGPDKPFLPERTASIDLGLKGGGPGMQWSLGLFRMDVHDLHANALPAGSIAPTIVNAGWLVSKGFEAEGAWVLAGDARLALSYGYLDAQVRSFQVPAADGTLVEAAPFTEPAGAPRHTLSLRLDSPKWPVADGLQLSGTADLRHQSSRFAAIAQRDGVASVAAAVGPRAADARLPALTLLNLRASLALRPARGGSARTELSLAVHNALDQRRRVGFIDVGGLYQLAYGSDPRRTSLTLSHAW